MKRTVLFIPLTVIALVAAITSCQKSLPPSPASAKPTVQPQAYLGAGNWNTLYYFGTPDGFGSCYQPCGFCHATPWQRGYQPNTSDPENNEALAELSLMNDGKLLLSVNLSGVGNVYVHDVRTTGEFHVAADTYLPQSVVDNVCDAAGVAHWDGVLVHAGTYPVNIESTADDSRLEMEGSYTADNGWSWAFFVR